MYVVNSYLLGGCLLLGRRRSRPMMGLWWAATGLTTSRTPRIAEFGRNSGWTDHPTLWRFIDGLRKVQSGHDKEYEDYVRGEQPQPKRQRYIQADRRILAIVRRTTYSATLRMVASTDPSDALQPHSEDRWAKHKSAEMVQDRITTFAQNSDRILRCAALAKLLVRSLPTTGPS
uniref:Uncharacterized protein n=1 Tax=Trichuris muris TaxID=70415 RepID=A0A5S6Q4B3_TRIMR